MHHSTLDSKVTKMKKKGGVGLFEIEVDEGLRVEDPAPLRHVPAHTVDHDPFIKSHAIDFEGLI